MSTWPRSRDPDQDDVELANSPLEKAFLDNFKNALLASPEAVNNEDLVHVNFQGLHGIETLTYPTSVLLDFPELPSDYMITQLHESFSSGWKSHILINNISIPSSAQSQIAPYLKLAIACLSSTAPAIDQTDQSALAKTLFIASHALWTVMLEVDNREARASESVVTAALLGVYATVSSDTKVWSNFEQQMLPSSITILRRLRLQESTPSDGAVTPQLLDAGTRTSLIGCFWLINVLGSLHLDIASCLTTNEIEMHLSSLGIRFQRAYRSLLDEDAFVPPGLGSREDAVLLLIAILCDFICLRRSLRRLARHVSQHLQQLNAVKSGKPSAVRTLYPPTLPHSEYGRMVDQLSIALDKWELTFRIGRSPNDLALYFCCRLYISCPELTLLPRLAGYAPVVQRMGLSNGPETIETIELSDDSIGYAWSVLDNTCDPYPIWSPVIVFLAALVVWTNITCPKTSSARTGSLKQILPFKLELDQMPWPCCSEMSLTLNRLVHGS
ncbi:hypothetical protein LTR84_004496 [Exophiala bonariae]|uniref:Transcription factor domain-containing protein n=1 Tax=Exophiala bonariae TaxID=1690606 RepID=A0AAV9N9E6_9EURO|nr:hypothetical protein LTR84_004496 [Exophiala bonariae]